MRGPCPTGLDAHMSLQGFPVHGAWEPRSKADWALAPSWSQFLSQRIGITSATRLPEQVHTVQTDAEHTCVLCFGRDGNNAQAHMGSTEKRAAPNNSEAPTLSQAMGPERENSMPATGPHPANCSVLGV